LEKIDRLAGSKSSRSNFIERVLRQDLCQRGKAALTSNDLKLINSAADQLNLEAAEVSRIIRRTRKALFEEFSL